jgi:hypothetical protein
MSPQSTGGSKKIDRTQLASCGILFEGTTSRPGDREMLRRILIACVAIAAIAAVVAPTDADARWRGGGGWHGGGHRGWGPGLGVGLGLGLGLGAGYGYPYYGGGYYGYGGCYRTVRVYTPYGPRLRRVWVCG